LRTPCADTPDDRENPHVPVRRALCSVAATQE
jgi:hypothetical protein